MERLGDDGVTRGGDETREYCTYFIIPYLEPGYGSGVGVDSCSGWYEAAMLASCIRT
jgi:hypothetical protein